MIRTFSVSVPYRGATFLNEELAKGYDEAYIVSVPYRGATFLNNPRRNNVERRRLCFRPLSGSYISQFSETEQTAAASTSFRPLSGSYISQFCETGVLDMTKVKRVSVPYRGATFLNDIIYIPDIDLKFPSPIGELHFSIYLSLVWKV